MSKKKKQPNLQLDKEVVEKRTAAQKKTKKPGTSKGSTAPDVSGKVPKVKTSNKKESPGKNSKVETSNKKESPEIRWRKKDIELLKRKVKNVNAKTRRLEKTNPEIVPEKTSFKELENLIKNRKEFNKLINSMDSYTKRNSKPMENKEGLKVFSFDWDLYKLKEKRENERRAPLLEELTSKSRTSRGEELGYTPGLGSVKEKALSPINKDFNNMKKENWKKAVSYIDKALDPEWRAKMDNLLKENYIKALINVGFDNEIQQMIAFIPVDDFLSMVDVEKEAEIDFIYDPLELEAKSQTLKDKVWKKLFDKAKEKYLNDLKNKGVKPAQLKRLRNMDRSEFLNTVVGEINGFEDNRGLIHLDYTIKTDF